MVENLALRGSELLVYAIIYGFSQSESGKYFGTLEYLAHLCCASKRTVCYALDKLIEKGLIVKEEPETPGIDTCKYRIASDERLQKLQGSATTVAKIATDGCKNCKGIPYSYNKDYNKNKETIIDIEKKVGENPTATEVSDTLFPPDPEKEKVAPKEKAPRNFVKPTIEQIQAYCDEHKININAKDFWYYYESVGWVVGKNRKPMKSWQASIYTWVRNDKLYSKSQASQPAERGQRTQRTGMADFKNVNAEYEGMRPLLESDFDEETLKELNKGIS